MLPAVLALGASVAWGIGDFIGGLKSRTLAPLAVLAVAQPVGFAAMTIVVLVHWEPWPGPSVLFAMPAALLGTLGLIAFYRGMAAGVISLVAPIAATGALLPVAFGLATGERPSSLQLAGIALAVGGAVVTSYEPLARSGDRLGAPRRRGVRRLLHPDARGRRGRLRLGDVRLPRHLLQPRRDRRPRGRRGRTTRDRKSVG